MCKDKVECSSKMDFLKDHWYYNENELLKLVELCFDWKSQGEGMRDLIFIGGDIHCGVTTVLTDEESGLQINHFTTSPVTNHVCGKFFGFCYRHEVLSKKKNKLHIKLICYLFSREN